MTERHGPHLDTKTLHQEDFELLDQAFFEDETRWINTLDGCPGLYEMSDYSPRSIMHHYREMRKYALRLRAILRESKNARHLRDMEVKIKELEKYQRWYVVGDFKARREK